MSEVLFPFVLERNTQVQKSRQPILRAVGLRHWESWFGAIVCSPNRCGVWINPGVVWAGVVPRPWRLGDWLRVNGSYFFPLGAAGCCCPSLE
jgi:hypothetical protein